MNRIPSAIFCSIGNASSMHLAVADKIFLEIRLTREYVHFEHNLLVIGPRQSPLSSLSSFNELQTALCALAEARSSTLLLVVMV